MATILEYSSSNSSIVNTMSVLIFPLISFPITLTLYDKSDYDIRRGIYLLSLVNTTNITFEGRYTLTFPQSAGKYEYTLLQSAGK